METIEAINKRRSIRKYKAKEVADDLIEKIIRAGMQAPSAVNEQPWHFVVVKDREALDDIPNFSPFAQMARFAPAGIIVCGDLNLQKIPGYWSQDCSACIENMLLAITDLGLGAVWTAIYPMEDRVAGFRKKFGLPDNIMPIAFIPIGYPDENPPFQDRFKPERIHREKW